MPKEEVVLVDKKDKEIGSLEKLRAHKEGKLHRAFSVLIFNQKGEMLLQKRSMSKYQSAGLWSNACCSHPRPGEAVSVAARRRLKEEMRITCDLKEVLSFVYKAKVGELVEHEFLHVFLGQFDGKPIIDKKEVADWRWREKIDLKKDIKENPNKYTAWFTIILDKYPAIAS